MVRIFYLILILSLFTIASNCQKQRTPEINLIPDGYVGWVKVYYNVVGAPALPIEDGYIVFRFPASGILKTSSAPEFGVAYDEYFYYSDDKRTLLRTTTYGEGGMIWGGYNGSFETGTIGENTEHTQEEKRTQYSGFFVGTEASLLSTA